MSQKGLPKIEPTSIKKILLIRLRRIGDIIMTTPAVSVLKRGFPQSSLTYIVEEPYRLLVDGNPYLDKIIALPRKRRFMESLELIKQIRKEKYDLVLDFHCGPRASLITLFSKAKLKLGYRIKFRHFIYDYTIPRSRENGYFHSVENHINLVKATGIKVNSPPPLFLPQVKEEERKKVQKFVKENKLNGAKIIVIHISAGNRFRDWGVKNLVQLANLLGKREDIKIILIGEKEDKEAEEEIVKRVNLSLHSLVGKLNLRELRDLISHSTLFIGPDSGPMHIAASTSTPIVAYFGPTLSAHFAPWKANAFIIEKDFDCRPCRQKHCLYKDFRCLQRIKPEEVYQACLRFI
ncbi:MAG: glycosyltransferase family 9 protein [Candidatus Aminicenantaceae bacterium]